MPYRQDRRAARARLAQIALSIQLAFGAGLLAMQPVCAQNADRLYDIPVGSPLAEALNRFALEAGVSIALDARSVQGLKSPGLKGAYGVEEGFARLLRGSGYRLGRTSAGYMLLREDPSSRGEDDAHMMPTVTVREIRESAYGPVEGYRAERTGTATRTDTALRETPVSVQVVPQQVIIDQQATRIADVIQNVSGARPGSTFGNRGDSFIVRGFQSYISARDGFVSNQLFGDPGFIDLANVERVEVLKGPASVMYGLGDPGGLVNIVTKRPLREPRRQITTQAGSFGFGRVEADLSQPLNADGSLAFRINAAYQNWGSHRDHFQDSRRAFVAPVLGWQIGPDTRVLLDLEHVDQSLPFDRGLLSLNGRVAPVPRDRYLGERWSTFELNGTQARYIVEHNVDSHWMIRHTGRYQESEANRFSADPRELQADGRTLRRRASDQRDRAHQWTMQLDLIGDFTRAETGHKLLAGVEAGQADKDVSQRTASLASIDIYAPVYGALPGVFSAATLTEQQIRYGALYLQDQIWLGERWKLLLGVRYDDTRQTTRRTNVLTENESSRVSPRAGIMVDLSDAASLYLTASKSFKPVSGTTFAGVPFRPETGLQTELGIKADWLDGRLGTTLAVYELKRRNVTTADPDNAGFSIQTGEQRSRGLELDLNGDLGGGWKLIGSAACTDARITRDNTYAPGNRVQGVPRWSGSLWLSRDITSGDRAGFGYGAGLFAAGERQGDLENSFRVGGYVRADASVHYRAPSWRGTLGVRNLFDRDYVESPVSDTEIYVGAPRTLMATLEFRM